MTLRLVIHKRIVYGVAQMDGEQEVAYSDDDTDCSEEVAEFGPFRDLEALKEGAKRFLSSEVNDVWDESAYEDLYAAPTVRVKRRAKGK